MTVRRSVVIGLPVVAVGVVVIVVSGVLLLTRSSSLSHAQVVRACRAALVVNLRHNDLLSWPRACDPLPRREVEHIATQIVFGG